MSPSSSTSSSATSTTAMLTFHPMPSPTSCAATVFLWDYTGPVDPMLLQLTNVGVSQDPPPSTTSSSVATTQNLVPRIIPRSVPSIPITPLNLTVTLASDYPPQSLSYFWNPVNVTQGWYMLLANISNEDLLQMSPSFFVSTGNDISCLEPVAISSTTHSPTPTPSSLSSLSSSASFHNISQPTSTPASDLSASTSKVPTIIGVTIGMAVLVIGSVIAVWFVLRKRRSRASNGDSRNNRWGGLNSPDPRGANTTNSRHHSSRSHLTSQPGSIAITIGTDFEEDGILGAEKSVTQLNLKTSNLGDDQGLALSTLPVLHHELSRTRPDHTYSASSSSSNVNDFGLPVKKPSSGRYSTDPSISISSTVYPPSFAVSSREDMVAPDMFRSSTTGAHFDQTSTYPSSIAPLSTFQFPPTSTTTAAAASRETQRQSIGRKRKPVPVYNASEEDATIFPNTPLSPFSGNAESVAFPELSHKSSFGPCGIEGRQLHYLIPDMPFPADR